MTNAKVIAFPTGNDAGGFTEDDVIALTEKLQLGTIGMKFSDAEVDFIERWGGVTPDSSSRTFCDAKIPVLTKFEQEPGEELGQSTWPNLAAILMEKER